MREGKKLKSELQNHKLSPLNPPRPVSLFLLLATLTLTACGNQNDSKSDSDNVSIKIPDVVNKLDQTAGTLRATISCPSGDQPMNIDTVNETASATCNSVPTGNTSFTVVFTYELGSFGPLDVATATKMINVTTGNNPLNFVNGDFDTASFDEDGDGISNILELDEFSITSPVSCTLGVAASLGTCELGT
jgi:hypothetical protein